MTSEYSSKHNILILGIQIGLYGCLLLISLFVCKEEKIKAEPEEIAPEKDDFAVPKEVKDEAERINACINGNDDA